MIYGTLNQPIKKDMKYRGGSTNTATVHIDGDLITVDAKIDVARIEHEYSNALKSIKSIQEYINSVKDNFDKYSGQIAAQNKKINEQSELLKQQVLELQQQKVDLEAQNKLIIEYGTKLDTIDSKLATTAADQKQILDVHSVKLNALQELAGKQSADLNAQKNDILQLYSDLKVQAEEIKNINSLVESISPEFKQAIEDLQSVIDNKLLQIKESLTTNFDTKIENLEEKTLKLINESFTETQGTLNNLQIKVAEIQNETSNFSSKLVTVNSKINKNTIAINDLSTDVVALNENVIKVKDLAIKCSAEIEDLDNRLNNINDTILPFINTKLDEVNEQVEHKFNELDTELDSKFAAVDSAMVDLQEKVNITIANKVEELQQKIEEFISSTPIDAEALNKKIDEHVLAAENEFNSINEKIVNAENSISELETAVLDQKDIIDSLENNIDGKLDEITYRSDKSIIDRAIAEKAASMYFDTSGEFDPSGQSNSYWYMTSNNDMSDPQIIAGPYNFGTGGGSGSGGGGGAISTTITLDAVDWPNTIAEGATCELQINWSSKRGTSSTGNGTVAVYLDGNIAFTQKNTPQGLVSLDITKYLTEGTHSVEVRVMDAYGNSDKIIQEITTVQIKLTSVFNADRILSDTFSYIYTPFGAEINKTTHFIIDGVEIGTQSTKLSGEQQTYKISDLSHGSHKLQVYFTCEISGEQVKSNELLYDLIYEVAGNETPIISSTFNELEQEQYTAFTIPYRVYTPLHNTSEIDLYINDEHFRSLTVTQDTQYWEYKSNTPGMFNFEIRCGEVKKEFNVHVSETSIKVQAVEQDLALYLTATGRSNAEANPEIWEDTERGISAELSNFNFVSDGWIKDDDGNTVLRVTGDARVEIPYQIFAKDARLLGKTIELEFATSTVKNYETNIISCWSGNRGISITPQLAKINSQQSALQTQYKEEEHVRIAFVIEKSVETHLILMYLNGVMSGAFQYPLDDNFRQLSPVGISIGSNDATVDIYNIRVYDNNLNRKQVVNNWIADTQSGELKRTRFIHNDNYNDSGEIVINKLPEDLPYIIWDIDPLPQFKGDKRKGQAYYVDPVNPSRSFRLPTKDGVPQGDYNVQGTSSAAYPVKNIRLKSKSGFIDNDLNTNKKFTITEGGIGDNYFTFKVDFASSEGANNVELVRLYNDISKSIGILTPPQKIDNKVRVGIDGYPIIAFHRTADGKDSFCTKANFNNDKANEAVYGFAVGDESWEITNNSADEANFKNEAAADTFGNAFEIRFPDEDGYSDLSKLGPMTAWIVSTDTEKATNEPLETPTQFTYDLVVRAEDGTFSTRQVETEVFTNDTREYRLAKFKAELKNWFDVDSTLFYYLFTHFFLMVDSRAKNAFPTYFASRKSGDGGDKWFWLPYDMDTALGINNEGKLVFDYSLEDTDQIEGADVYNGQSSVLWNNLRETFDGEIGQMYANLRTSGSLLSFEEVEKRFEQHQNKWSETIFNEDSYHKYIVPLIETGDNYLEMLQGSKAEQRKWWLYNRFKYFDSKYLAGEAKSDVFQFRAYGKADITIVPYADIYAAVSYANAAGAVVSVRAKRGQSYTLPNPLPSTASDQETYIYSASQLKSVGDLSPFKPDTVKAANAIKLQELKIGDASPDYVNPNLKELTLGRNILLRSLDVRNCINLARPIDISNCTNIEEIYFDNTKITGLNLPVGGIIKTLHLPNTLTNLTIRNHKSLTDLQIAGTENVQSLWLENIPEEVIDAKAIIMEMPEGAAVRLIGFKQIVNTTEEIEALYTLLDTMSGINAQGENVEKAVISGEIQIDTITYADHVRLSKKYPDIKIKAKHIICNVVFMNEDQIVSTQNVELNHDAYVPENPTKAETISHYYVFENWDSEKYLNVQSDCVINAVYSEHIQIYTVTFNTQSTLTSVSSVDVEYNNLVTEPDEPSIPGDVFKGWYTEPETINLFDFNTPITGHITLYAKWYDETAPIVVDVLRLNYNTFEYTVTDNTAVTAYAITTSDEVPSEWISIEPVTPYVRTYTITASGTYYVWAKDAANNTASKSITAYDVISNIAIGATLELAEGEAIIEHPYAISGTTVTVTAELDSHYENLEVVINGLTVENGLEYTFNDNTNIEIKCTPKFYTVRFDVGDHGEFVDDQIIEYNHYVIKPDPQFTTGLVLEDWYLEKSFKTRWDFNTNPIDRDIILYAKWIDYLEPSVITINLESAGTVVTCNFWQLISEGVTVDWGDGTEYTYEGTNTTLSESHMYLDAGTYEIRITCTEGQHQLGGGDGKPVISPADIITNIEFAWNMATTNAYCLKGATQLTSLNLSRFMTDIAPGMYQNCTGIQSIEIPASIKRIGNSAFQGCSGITGTVDIPRSVVEIGSTVFESCTGIESVILPDSISSLNELVFQGCSSLTSVSIPTTITEIPFRAFFQCTALAEFDVSEHITFLGREAFSGCTSLSKVILRNPNLVLDDLVFSVTNITSMGPLGDGNEYDLTYAWVDAIPNYAFSCGAAADTSKLKTVVLPDTIKSIGRSAFAFCRALTTINLPVGLEKIDDLAFFWCRRLSDTSVQFPETLEYIGAQAYANCYALSRLVIPFNVSYIGNKAFEGSYSVKAVYLYTTASTNKIDAAVNSWFTSLGGSTKLYIPSVVTDPISAYGQCWNFYSTTGELGYEATLD